MQYILGIIIASYHFYRTPSFIKYCFPFKRLLALLIKVDAILERSLKLPRLTMWLLGIVSLLVFSPPSIATESNQDAYNHLNNNNCPIYVGQLLTFELATAIAVMMCIVLCFVDTKPVALPET